LLTDGVNLSIFLQIFTDSVSTETYAHISSPSPTPSLREGDSSSQIDELFLPSPPDNLPAVLDFESAKMGALINHVLSIWLTKHNLDEIQIPRLNRIGQRPRKLPLGEGKR
jgi:hypothetical protein